MCQVSSLPRVPSPHVHVPQNVIDTMPVHDSIKPIFRALLEGHLATGVGIDESLLRAINQLLIMVENQDRFLNLGSDILDHTLMVLREGARVLGNNTSLPRVPSPRVHVPQNVIEEAVSTLPIHASIKPLFRALLEGHLATDVANLQALLNAVNELLMIIHQAGRFWNLGSDILDHTLLVLRGTRRELRREGYLDNT